MFLSHLAIPVHVSYKKCQLFWKVCRTRGPLGHLLDTAISCFRATKVGITVAEKLAVEKLQFHYLNVSLK